MDNIQLTVADMASLKQILDAACQRGAFKASEMSTVGQIYNKLDAFLAAATAQLEAGTNAAAEHQGEANA